MLIKLGERSFGFAGVRKVAQRGVSGAVVSISIMRIYMLLMIGSAL